ncbi:MAG: hypothetical protein ACYCR4_12710, partial [Acidimicrobiales bacterium]
MARPSVGGSALASGPGTARTGSVTLAAAGGTNTGGTLPGWPPLALAAAAGRLTPGSAARPAGAAPRLAA